MFVRDLVNVKRLITCAWQPLISTVVPQRCVKNTVYALHGEDVVSQTLGEIVSAVSTVHSSVGVHQRGDDVFNERLSHLGWLDLVFFEVTPLEVS